MTVRFGFGLITCQRYPGDPRTDTQVYADAIELAVLAEELGFDSVWVSEHHFVDDAYLPSLLPVCAAIAARTERVQIGTALLLAPLYEPLRLAEDAAVVDLISAGRLILGLGLGWRAEEFEALAVPIGERAARMEDTVAVLRQAWSGGPVTGGTTLRAPSVRVTPDPHARGGPPVWIGAISQAGTRRAGRIADGFMATNPSPESLTRQIGWVRDGLGAAGRDRTGFAFSAHAPTYPWEGDPQAAWERVRPFAHYVSWKYDDMEEARGRLGQPAAPPPLSPEDEKEHRRDALVGPPTVVADGIQALAAPAGGDLHFIARLYWPGMAPNDQRDAMRLFAETVIPSVRSGTGQAR
jgi:alkanesulfonate monooxygenase SsuD/methylene tetrahydromethanopterin reductase-like flavin-dependent oxidoreductase (luciferase family)